jgi:BASS family bile acid:Na+ symporter
VKGFCKGFALPAAMVAGALSPWAAAWSGGIRWLLMGILLLFFMQLRRDAPRPRRAHAWLLLANIGMGFAGLGLGWLTGTRDVALGLFFAGIAPTATAAPVVTAFLRGRADFVVTGFLVTNAGVALLAPFLFPVILGHVTAGVFLSIVESAGVTLCAPLAAACLLRRLLPRAEAWAGRTGAAAFGLWVAALFLVMASAGDFLRRQDGLPAWELAALAAGSLLVCAANFAVGFRLGGREFGREGSQTLGQKNTTLMIYLALTHANPLAALGPAFYVIWHNTWNALQLARARRR